MSSSIKFHPDAPRPGDAQAIIDHTTRLAEPKILSPTGYDGANRNTLVAVPAGQTLINPKKLLEDWLPTPERRIGTAKLADAPSFIEHVNRFKDENSAIYAQRAPKPTITAVLDYHERTGGTPRWGQHRSEFQPVTTETWAAWAGVDGKPMSQTALATFLDDRILDIAPPPAPEDAQQNALLQALGGTSAGQTTLIETVRNLRLREDSEVANIQNIHTGEIELVHKTRLSDATGQPLKVPTCFSVAVQAFENAEMMRLWIRLTFRKKVENGIASVEWTLKRWRPDLLQREAFDKLLAQIQGGTELVVMIGTPE
jgi:uncharacterized protein YfdQ (DUF2303 family)